MPEKKDAPELPKNPRPETPVHVGHLKESDRKKMESEIVSSLKRLGKEMTHKDIGELIAAIERSKSLAALKEELSGMHQDKDEAMLEEILHIAESIRRGAIEGIKELRVDIGEVLRNMPVELRKGMFLSERFGSLARFEKSELGENIVVDIAGFGIGAIDSVYVIAKLIAHLLSDLFYLPRDIAKVIRKSN